jgi:hypothetical protein
MAYSIEDAIILTSFTFGSVFLYGTALKLHNDRLIKFPNTKFHSCDLLNLSLMTLSGISIFTLYYKAKQILDKL